MGAILAKRHQILGRRDKYQSSHAYTMLTELYIEALLVDEELADLVWELLEAGLIPDDLAAIAWSAIVMDATIIDRVAHAQANRMQRLWTHCEQEGDCVPELRCQKSWQNIIDVRAVSSACYHTLDWRFHSH